MSTPPVDARHPLIFEANARLLLRRLSRRYRRQLTLGSVPLEYWRELAVRFQFLWLMGVWERSDASRERALADAQLRRAYSAALPDWSAADIGGSPYAVYRCRLDPALGREGELVTLRRQLAAAGLGVILDFVPNHVARDHPWTLDWPDRFVRPDPPAASRHPGWFFTTAGGLVLAHGRDPHLAPWTDTAQFDFSSGELRRALIAQLLSIARVSDGVRCDMAMLALSDVHTRTWGAISGGTGPREEFWGEAIHRVRREYPSFLFIAEAYCEIEPRLVELGFDYAYDKGLYDALRGGAPDVRRHLDSDPLGAHGLRFTENHDEPRAAALFERDQGLAAATIAATLPGAFLVHDGQLEGRRRHLPVQLLREPYEPVDDALSSAYQALLEAASRPPIGTGTRRRLVAEGIGADGAGSLFAWCWDGQPAPCVVAVNYSPERAHGRFLIEGVEARSVSVRDRLRAPQGRDAHLGADAVIEIALGPWEARILDLLPGC